MEITFARKNRNTQWHIKSAGYGSPACHNADFTLTRNTSQIHGFIEVDETIEDGRLVILDMRGERVCDPDDVCGSCKEALIATLKRLRKRGKV